MYTFSMEILRGHAMGYVLIGKCLVKYTANYYMHQSKAELKKSYLG